jgi:hypothetical protein
VFDKRLVLKSFSLAYFTVSNRTVKLLVFRNWRFSIDVILFTGVIDKSCQRRERRSPPSLTFCLIRVQMPTCNYIKNVSRSQNTTLYRSGVHKLDSNSHPVMRSCLKIIRLKQNALLFLNIVISCVEPPSEVQK